MTDYLRSKIDGIVATNGVVKPGEEWDAARLKAARLALGMTQEEIAILLDIPSGGRTVSAWENGENTPLRRYRGRLYTIIDAAEKALRERA